MHVERTYLHIVANLADLGRTYSPRNERQLFLFGTSPEICLPIYCSQIKNITPTEIYYACVYINIVVSPISPIFHPSHFRLVYFLHYQSFYYHSRNFVLVNSTFLEICKKCFRGLTQYLKFSPFVQTFLTNPSKRRISEASN